MKMNGIAKIRRQEKLYYVIEYNIERAIKKY
jgi:hypothetical protein